MYVTISPTVSIMSVSLSRIWQLNSDSMAIPSRVSARESAPRSSLKVEAAVIDYSGILNSLATNWVSLSETFGICIAPILVGIRNSH